MVSFQLAPEQQDLRDSVAQFAREVVAPVIGGYYERGEFPYDIVARMGKLGLFGLPFPEDHGQARGPQLGGGRQQGLHHQRGHLDHLPGDGHGHHRPR
jgi:alkylation response protein AidB-like acyl-CoA dehydrogenase